MRRSVAVTTVLAVALAFVGVVAPTPALAATLTYNDIGTYTVPSGVTAIVLTAYGAEGATGTDHNGNPLGGPGGKGGMTKGRLAVTAGQVFDLGPGRAGNGRTGGFGYDEDSGGAGGTSDNGPGYHGGGGGGATMVQLRGGTGGILIAMAGGGGGGGGESALVNGDYSAGIGGAGSGGNNAGYGGSSGKNGGGTQSGPGTGGTLSGVGVGGSAGSEATNVKAGKNGFGRFGGAGGGSQYGSGGGGGGGFFGAGGGGGGYHGGGGGGGSGYASNQLTNVQAASGVRAGNGAVIIQEVTGSAKAIAVTSPNGGESWARGSTRNITWSWTNASGATIKILLLKAGTKVLTIQSSRPIGAGGTGSYSWKIPTSLGAATTYKIKLVINGTSPTVTDASNANFRIT